MLLAVNYALVQRSLADRLRPVAVEAAGEPLPEVAPRVGTEVWRADPDEVFRELESRFRDEALHQLVVQSSIALGIMAVASVGLGWIVAGRALRPLAHVTATARHLSQDNLHQRLALEGPPDELKELADTFDAMLERLESAFDGQRRFVANASHELRTPLSIQRTLVDVALADPDASREELRAMAVSVRDAVDRSERLIDGLLVLARSNDRSNLERVPCDLASAASLALDQFSEEARARGLRVETALAPAPVTANRVLLERLVANLVQNAVRHNVDGGWLQVHTASSDGTATVRVCNIGQVVPPEQVEALFEPFRRVGPDRTGSQRGVGLGLSIVRAVAVAHEGTVDVTARPSGGLDVEVRFPSRPVALHDQAGRALEG